MLFFLSLACLLFGHALATFIPTAELLQIDNHHVRRQPSSSSSSSTTSATATATSLTPDAVCTNGPYTRQCWDDGYSIATNFDTTWPTTGNVVSYTLEVTNTTMAPDGVPRTVYAVNGQYQGPTIRASWGDTLQITVKNSLTTNGTSMHWHGVRQWHSNQMDGTNGITECPLAPGKSRTYTFLCTQFGTTWYHSHYSDQYSDGVVGTIIIDGPATSNYDVDLGTFPFNDWYHTPAFTLGPLIQDGGFPRGPPPGDNILINGTNVNILANASTTGAGAGAYSRTVLTKGKKYRLRLINMSTNDNFQVGLDGHNFTVISSDFVPIVPFTTQWLFMGIGQRYDVTFTANQPVGSYWFHVVPQTGCASNNNPNALAIFSYVGDNSTTPSNATRSNAPPGADCSDPNGSIVPYVKFDVPSNYTIPQSSDLDVGFAIIQNQAQQTLFQWNLNFTAIQVAWGDPTLQYVLNNDTNYPTDLNLIPLPNANAWSYWVIQAVATIAPPIPHPIHLHGHDFFVLGAGTGIFNNSQTLNYKNPPRRDVAMLPASGYLVLAFVTDNPGAWLMHCHIAWHVGLGFGAQFLEEPNSIRTTLGIGEDWQQECTDWNAYYSSALFLETDSGL
jgi:FtsP/CotA-like multicopper oxidase with cupredoxin domain